MIDKQYFIGYTKALENIEKALKEFMDSNNEALEQKLINVNDFSERQTAFNTVKSYVIQVHNNYRTLAKEIIDANKD